MQHSAHAGHFFRVRRVNADDARVRVRTAQKFRVQHARQLHIERIFCRARYAFNAIHARNRLADHAQILLHIPRLRLGRFDPRKFFADAPFVFDFGFDKFRHVLICELRFMIFDLLTPNPPR